MLLVGSLDGKGRLTTYAHFRSFYQLSWMYITPKERRLPQPTAGCRMKICCAGEYLLTPHAQLAVMMVLSAG
jgi:hypothetical protein